MLATQLGLAASLNYPRSLFGQQALAPAGKRYDLTRSPVLGQSVERECFRSSAREPGTCSQATADGLDHATTSRCPPGRSSVRPRTNRTPVQQLARVTRDTRACGRYDPGLGFHPG